MSARHLLPPYRGVAETALAQAVAGQFPIMHPNRTLWNPWTCPTAHLPFLAWALSVDEWDHRWPEQVRRAAIANSVPIHRRKGTIGSVRRALEALGASIEISEWYQTGDAPHTFRLDAWADDVFGAGFNLNNRFFNLVARQIELIKPARSHFTLRVGERFNTHGYLRTGLRDRYHQTLDVDPGPERQRFTARVHLRAQVRQRQTSTVTHEAMPQRHRARPIVAVRLESPMRVISRITHDVLRQEAA